MCIFKEWLFLLLFVSICPPPFRNTDVENRLNRHSEVATRSCRQTGVPQRDEHSVIVLCYRMRADFFVFMLNAIASKYDSSSQRWKVTK